MFRMILKRTMIAKLEHLSFEIFLQIFSYFEFHEIFQIFSNLNSRFSAMMNNLSFIPVYLGYNGMSLGITKFYYQILSQSNIANRLISLCVSDTFAIDNGLWLAKHASMFSSLRHLSLKDIKRSSFELMLNSLSIMKSIFIFNVDFSVQKERAANSFEGVPEGAYYERIFYLFPSLRIFRLLICQDDPNILDFEFILPIDKTFLPVQSNLFNLQSLTLHSSLSFLSHLIEYLPQLEQLDYTQTAHWLPRNHPMKYKNYKLVFSSPLSRKKSLLKY